MKKIQNSISLTARTKEILKTRCQHLGLSQNEYIEALILASPKTKQKVELTEDISIFYEQLPDGSWNEIELYESFSGSIFGKLDTVFEENKKERLLAILKDLAVLFSEI